MHLADQRLRIGDPGRVEGEQAVAGLPGVAIGAYLATKGQITIGTFVTFESAFWEVSYNIAHVMHFIPVSIQSAAAIRHIQELLDEPTRGADRPGAPDLPRITHDITFDRVSFQYEDSRRYGCDFDWAQDRLLPEHDPDKTILQPRNNLLCGIRIVENQIVTQHKPLLSNSSYWVTLRPDNPSIRMFLKQMANEPAFCGRPLVRGVPPPTVRQTPPLTQAANRPAPAVPRTASAEPAEEERPAARHAKPVGATQPGDPSFFPAPSPP